ncbi:response regulator transcription factor [uncultured Ramlibacter sp.]|uniref:LuxR C-terminal-related transcriptional regulator n=1 Tax=uncultured Ramlibacter sp. TaxID=260755 RepID=UPI00261C5100|nr:response regulator transcription factor [uncultured Ramlibacter sp.]
MASPVTLADAVAAAASAQVTVADYETATALATAHWGRAGMPRILVVTPRETESDVQSALAVGILGYVPTDCRAEDIVQGALALGRGQRHLSEIARQRIAERLSYPTLTQREAQVLELVATGWSNKMIGNRLGVVEGTVKTHVKAILEKLCVRSRTEAAHVAIRRGLVSRQTPSGLQPASAAVRRANGDVRANA